MNIIQPHLNIKQHEKGMKMKCNTVSLCSATLSFLIGLLVLLSTSYAGPLFVDGALVCQETTTILLSNDQLTVDCTASTIPPTPIPDVLPPELTPPGLENPTPGGTPTPEPTVGQGPLPPADETCGIAEPNPRLERFAGRGVDKEYTLANDSVLVVPITSGAAGSVQKVALGEPGRGEHFKKTVVLSTCAGVYNPDEYNFASSVDVCAITGLELSFSIISGENRSDYPLSSYRCVLKPNTQYYLNVFQRDAGNRPPYSADTNNTCRTAECGVRVSIR